MSAMNLSRASVTSYLPYAKGVYFSVEESAEKISAGTERQRRYRAVKKLRDDPTEEHLWDVILVYAGVKFKTYSGLPFTYEIRKGRDGRYGLIDVPDSVKEYIKGKNPTVALPGMGNTPLWDFFCPGELL